MGIIHFLEQNNHCSATLYNISDQHRFSFLPCFILLIQTETPAADRFVKHPYLLVERIPLGSNQLTRSTM